MKLLKCDLCNKTEGDGEGETCFRAEDRETYFDGRMLRVSTVVLEDDEAIDVCLPCENLVHLALLGIDPQEEDDVSAEDAEGPVTFPPMTVGRHEG